MNNKTFVHQQQVFISSSQLNEQQDKAARLQINETSTSPNSIKSRINEKGRSCQTGTTMHFPQVNASSDKLRWVILEEMMRGNQRDAPSRAKYDPAAPDKCKRLSH